MRKKEKQDSVARERSVKLALRWPTGQPKSDEKEGRERQESSEEGGERGQCSSI